MIHRPKVADGLALLDWIRREVASHVPAGRVLDVGAGAGSLPDHDNVTALDIAPSAPHLDQVAATLSHIPFDDASFDAAVCINVFTNVERAAVNWGVSEMLRVTRPGGTLAFTSPNLDHPLIRIRSMWWRMRTGSRESCALSADWLRERLAGSAKVERCEWILPHSLSANPVRRRLAEGYATIATRVPRLSPHWILVARRS